jgi:hypothetical protein
LNKINAVFIENFDGKNFKVNKKWYVNLIPETEISRLAISERNMIK